MKHVIVFLLFFTILIGVSALTIQWLAGKGDKGKRIQRNEAVYFNARNHELV